MDPGLYTLKEVSRELGVKSYRLNYLLSNGLVPDVPLVGGRRLWTREQVEQLRHALIQYEDSRDTARKAGRKQAD